MPQKNIPLQIIEFWDWFQKNEHMFREVIDPEHAVESMDEQVLAFGMFAWEIGEGKSKPHYFTLSPNGDKGRLELSKKIIGAAPELSEWEFYPSKQPKQDWDFSFEAFDRYFSKHIFDASNWDYILEKNEDANIEIIVRADNLHVMDLDDELNAVDMVITNIIGEELSIHHLDAFETVNNFEEEQMELCKKIPKLKTAFEELLKSKNIKH